MRTRVLPTLFLLLVIVIQPSFGQGNPFMAGSKPTAVSVNQSSGFFSRIVEIQRDLQFRLGKYISDVSNDENHSPYMLMVFIAFLYGFFHALGPGHRKIVLVSAILKKEITLAAGLVAGFSISMLHAFSAITVVILLHWIVDSSLMTVFNTTSITIETVSYAILILIGITILIRQSLRKEHTHGKELPAIIASSALIPCPGAAAIMIISINLGSIYSGVFLVIAMSLGMAVVTTGISVIIGDIFPKNIGQAFPLFG